MREAEYGSLEHDRDFLIEISPITRVDRIRAPLLVTFLLTFGLEILIVNLLNFFFKADTRSVMTPYSGSGFTVGSVRVPYIRLGALGVSILLVLMLGAFLTKSRLGRAIRGTGMDIDAARLTGVKAPAIYALTFGIGAACVGAAGAMLVLIIDVTPPLGPAYTLLAFVIVITGGLGSMPGALLGGVLIGMTEALAGLLFTPSAKSMFAFAILVIVLLLRPQGILGKRSA